MTNTHQPELPAHRPEFSVDEALRIADQNADAYDKVASVSRTLAAEVRRLAALSRPQDAPDGFVLVPVIPTEEMIARGDEIIAEDGKRVRPESIYDAMVSGGATPTAGQGGDCRHEWTTVGRGGVAKRALACMKCGQHRDHMREPTPAPAAPVSERARVRIDQTTCNCHPETCCCGPYTLTLDGEFITSGHEPHVKRVACALEQALTQQRGECEAVAWQVEWIDNAGDPTRYIAYCEEDADDKLGVLSDGEAATAKVIPLYTTPQPGAEALRGGIRNVISRIINDGRDREWVIRELESLLAGGGNHG